MAIESMPDLTQPSRESQLSAKSGTDDQNIAENILPKSCFSGIETDSNVEQCTQTGLDNEQKTQLRLNTEAEFNTTEPKVGGPNPSRRS